MVRAFSASSWRSWSENVCSDALGDEIIDGDEREGENRHQAQDELTEDARGQASLSHCGIVIM